MTMLKTAEERRFQKIAIANRKEHMLNLSHIENACLQGAFHKICHRQITNFEVVSDDISANGKIPSHVFFTLIKTCSIKG